MDLAKYGPWALIVGGSEGIGAAFARKLAADGFKLVLVARRPEPLEETAADLRKAGAEVRAVCADLSHADALDRARAATDDIEVGFLVYNPGPMGRLGDFMELPEEITRPVVAINVLGMVDFTRHYGALMRRRGRGGIITTGSLGGYMGVATAAAFTASKAFSRTFTEALWAECEPVGVAVLHLNIGATTTPGGTRARGEVPGAESADTVAQEGLDNIANGPTWIVSSAGNVERARQSAAFDGRAERLRALAVERRQRLQVHA